MTEETAIQVAERAYYIFLARQRDGIPGDEMSDWMQALREHGVFPSEAEQSTPARKKVATKKKSASKAAKKAAKKKAPTKKASTKKKSAKKAAQKKAAKKKSARK